MPSTFTSNTGIEKIADGELSGLWGQTTNLNFDIVDRALNGSVDVALSGTTHTLTTSDGVLSDGQFAVLTFTGALSAPNTVTIAPNTAQKTYWVRNTTSEDVILSQGSGANVTVPPGATKAVYADGAGAGAAVVDLASVFFGNVTGNADTATALQTARTIGGVSFDGTANINLPGVNIGGNQNTTGGAASLTTARTLTIGSTGKTFDGTANVSWSLFEVGVGTLGQQDADDVAITGGTINAENYRETVGTIAGSTLDLSTGNVFSDAPATNVTYAFDNPPASGAAYGFTLKVAPSATVTVTWPASVKWPGGTAPDAPASGETAVYVFYTQDGGTTYFGFVAGEGMS